MILRSMIDDPIRTVERRPRFVKEVPSALRMVGFPFSSDITAEGSQPEGSLGVFLHSCDIRILGRFLD